MGQILIQRYHLLDFLTASPSGGCANPGGESKKTEIDAFFFKSVTKKYIKREKKQRPSGLSYFPKIPENGIIFQTDIRAGGSLSIF